MNIDDLVNFGQPAVMPDRQPVASEKLISGQPIAGAANYYETSDSKFFSGIWESTPGKWRISYEEHEFCHILEGLVEVTDGQGGKKRYARGDSFVIPAGFSGTWETIEATRKLYAVYLA